jgi:tetratricopeptide (TPR) repeat protein
LSGLCALCALCGSTLAQRPDSDHRVAQAQRRLDQAFYKLAIESFEPIAADVPVESAVGIARCRLELGEPQASLDGLDKADLPDNAKNHAAIHTVRGLALGELGRYDDAIAAFEQAVSADETAWEARAACGELLIQLGRLDDARETLAPFDASIDREIPDDPEARVQIARGMLLRNDLDPAADVSGFIRNVLQQVIQPGFQEYHPAAWKARLAAADLLAAKHNLAEARADYERVAKANPRVPGPHVGLAELALEQQELDKAFEHVMAALGLNSDHAAALRTLAKIRLAQSDPLAALGSLTRRLATNPSDLEALALAAAASEHAGRIEQSCEFLRRAAAVNPKSGLVQYTLGVWLAARRQFDRAEAHLKAAAEFAPHRPEYQAELADLWMMRGREEPALEALKKARAADPFNGRVVHLLNVLYDLERMERVETDHFVLRYEQDSDRLIGLIAPPVLEECYAEITAAFPAYRPPGEAEKTLVEIFPRQDQFASRVSGRPWIGTVGASTGPVIAMVSPRKDAKGVYGWADVLRHEFTHTVTLALSESRIPRWMTEGLAEKHEGSRLSWEMTTMLVHRLRKGALFKLSDIDAGFFGQAPDDRPVAYAQGRMMVEFIDATWGTETIHRLLTAYREQLDGKRAFEETLATTFAEFDQRFAEWLTARVGEWGFSITPYPDRPTVKLRIEQDDKDAEALGQMALLELFDRNLKSAVRYAEAALAIDPRQADALLVKAHTPIEGADDAQIAPELLAQRQADRFDEIRPLLDLRSDEPTAVLAVAEAARRAERKELAADLCLKLTRRTPSCTPAWEALAELYLEVGDGETAYPFLVEWARGTPHKPEPAIKLAELLEQLGLRDAAAEWAKRVIRIDLFDLENHKRLGRLLVATGRWAEALGPLKLFCELSPNDDTAWADLAEAYAKLDRRSDAIAAAEKAISLNADTRAQRILEQLELEGP